MLKRSCFQWLTQEGIPGLRNRTYFSAAWNSTSDSERGI